MTKATQRYPGKEPAHHLQSPEASTWTPVVRRSRTEPCLRQGQVSLSPQPVVLLYNSLSSRCLAKQTGKLKGGQGTSFLLDQRRTWGDRGAWAHDRQPGPPQQGWQRRRHPGLPAGPVQPLRHHHTATSSPPLPAPSGHLSVESQRREQQEASGSGVWLHPEQALHPL